MWATVTSRCKGFMSHNHIKEHSYKSNQYDILPDRAVVHGFTVTARIAMETPV